MAAAQYFDQVQKIFIAFYQRPADPAGLKYWASRVDAAGGNASQVINEFATSAEATALYGTIDADSIGDVVDDIYMALFNVMPDAAGKAFYVDGFNAGTFTAGTIALAVLDGAQNDDLIALNNKVEVANEFTQQVDGRDFTDPAFGSGTAFNATYAGNADAEAARDFLATVGSNPATIPSDSAVTDIIKAEIANAGDPILEVDTSGNMLTVGQDTILGTAEGQTFTAPVVQNGMGAQTNTLGSGDVIAGIGDGNKLVVDLTLTTAGALPLGDAISASTNNIQIVELRAQTPIIDIGGVYPNFSHIDAEKFFGVEEWWSVNSRSNMQVEDVGTRPEDTTIGMRNTDPFVDFRVYFGPDQLDENIRPEDSQLTLKVADIAAVIPGDLTNVPIDGLKFQLDGVSYTLRSTEIGAATTYAEFVAGLEAAIALQPALATLEVELNADNTITLTDTAGKPFTLGGWFFVNDSVPANGNIVFQQTVGDPSLVDVPISTNVVLDNVGRTSEGGDLDIGSLGKGGVAEFNVVVDRDSWVESMQSNSYLGNGGGAGEQTEHLERVTFTSTGANGNVTVGDRTNNLDGRVNASGGADGLVDVREVDGSAFMGTMNLAIRLDSGVGANNSIARYLNGATDPVEFSYKGGAQADIFNIFVDTNVSNDSDFRMDVDMGASDDRLILRGADKLNNISVDGGTGNNTFVTSTSVGFGVNPADIADHEFASFKNFQTYEVEGNVVTTEHDFTSMSGVQNVIIATNGGVNTQLIDLEAAQNVTVSGKNQTIGNNSTADQNFGTITLTNDAGADRTITLENTARLSNSTNGVRQDGVLTVAALQIDTTPATAVGATRNVTIESEGVRTTANVVDSFVGRDVEKLTLTGTQDLTINVNQMANQAANAAPGTNTSTSVQINAAGLTGDLNLAVNGSMLNNFGGVPPMPAQVDTIVGTAGSDDTLMFYGALAAGNAVNASGFESVQLGTRTNTMFGDLAVGPLFASGTLNTANLGVSQFEIAAINNPLTLAGLAGGASVDLGDANRDSLGARVLTQTVNDQINLQSSALTAATTAGVLNINRLDVIASGTINRISVGDSVVGAIANTGGFRTINLDVARDASLALTPAVSDNNRIDLDVGSQARTLNVTGGQAGRSNVGAQAAQVAIAEVQTVDFNGSTATANGNINVGGITVALVNGDADTVIATKVAAALNAVGAGTAIGDATYTAAGTLVTANFAAADGNVPDNTLAVTDGTAVIGGLPVIAFPTQGQTAIVATLQVADRLNLAALGNELDNSLEVIDLSGYNGQVNLAMESTVVGAQTDVNFVMSAYSANIDLTDMGGAPGAIPTITHNSVFEFTGSGSVAVPSVWTIDDIVNAGAVGAGVGNNTVFDLSGLNIANYAGVQILYVDDGDVATDLAGNNLAAGSAVIRSETQANGNAETWEIIVTAADGAGLSLVGGNELTVDNFYF